MRHYNPNAESAKIVARLVAARNEFTARDKAAREAKHTAATDAMNRRREQNR